MPGGAAGISGWRSWWGAVARLTALTWRQGAAQLVFGVLAAWPAAGIIVMVAVYFEARVGRSPAAGGKMFGPGVLLIPVVLLVPFVIAGGYVVARAWTAAAWVSALRAAGLPADPADGSGAWSGARRCAVVWGAYLAGVAVLCVIAGWAGDSMTNDTLVRTTLTSVGPLGLLTPLILLAPGQLRAGRPGAAGPARNGHARQPGRDRPGWRLSVLVIAVLACQLAIGVGLSPMVNAARLVGVVAVLIGFILSIPAAVLLAAAGQVTFAERYPAGAIPRG
jgi:hypothetical protein